jgi:hypothetical protein
MINARIASFKGIQRAVPRSLDDNTPIRLTSDKVGFHVICSKVGMMESKEVCWNVCDHGLVFFEHQVCFAPCFASLIHYCSNEVKVLQISTPTDQNTPTIPNLIHNYIVLIKAHHFIKDDESSQIKPFSRVSSDVLEYLTRQLLHTNPSITLMRTSPFRRNFFKFYWRQDPINMGFIEVCIALCDFAATRRHSRTVIFEFDFLIPFFIIWRIFVLDDIIMFRIKNIFAKGCYIHLCWLAWLVVHWESCRMAGQRAGMI